MISIITGKPGSGKTYMLASKAKEFLAKGFQVYCNVPLNTKSENYHYFQEWFEIMNAKNGIIIMDEAQYYLNCRKWEDLPFELQYKLQQHRKQGLNIWGAVQNINRLDVVMRELVNRYYEVRKLGTGEKMGGGWPTYPFGLFLMFGFDPKDANRVKRNLYSLRFQFLRKSVCNFYDTSAEYGLPTKKDNKNIASVQVEICSYCKSKKVKWSTLH